VNFFSETQCNDAELFVENCTASHSTCETIWNTDIRQLYSDLIDRSLSRNQLQSFCRFFYYL